MFSQFKAYLYGGAALIVAGLAVTIWVQSVRIDKLKADVEQARKNTSICVAANTETQKTIAELKAERDRAGRSCARQIADKNKLIAELQKIDGTGGNNANDSAHSGDAVLDMLNSLLPGQGGGKDGVCQAGGPAGAAGAPVVPGDVLYCLDEVNAKNLAKDWALCKAWANEGVHLLDGLRTIEKTENVAR